MPATYASPENATRNVQTLRANLLRDLSLPDDATVWTVEQRYQYSRRFAEFVLAHQSSFTLGHYDAAQSFLSRVPNGYPPAENTSLRASVNQFVDEFLSNATSTLPKAGYGTLIAIAVGVAIFLVIYNKRQNAVVS